jgi:hypothetical protein
VRVGLPACYGYVPVWLHGLGYAAYLRTPTITTTTTTTGPRVGDERLLEGPRHHLPPRPRQPPPAHQQVRVSKGQVRHCLLCPFFAVALAPAPSRLAAIRIALLAPRLLVSLIVFFLLFSVTSSCVRVHVFPLSLARDVSARARSEQKKSGNYFFLDTDDERDSLEKADKAAAAAAAKAATPTAGAKGKAGAGAAAAAGGECAVRSCPRFFSFFFFFLSFLFISFLFSPCVKLSLLFIFSLARFVFSGKKK